MDSRLEETGFAINLSSCNGLESQSSITVEAAMRNVPVRRPDCLLLSKRNILKRKWNDFEGHCVQDAVLSLGPIRSSSSSDNSKRSSETAYSLSSSKETDEETSMDLDLNFDLSLGHENSLGTKICPVDVLKLTSNKPRVELDLCLSVGLGTSDVMDTVSASVHHQGALNFSSTVTVDDVSASSQWNCRKNFLSDQQTSKSIVHCYKLENHQTSLCHELPGHLPMAENIVEDPVACSSIGSVQQQRNSNLKTCQFTGCLKGARGASGLCISHGGGRRCQKAGCNKGAEGRTIFCKAHGGGRRCEFLGCTKSAEGKTDYCIAHGGGRRCSHDGCARAARGKSGLCIRHGGGKRCKMENCSKSAEGQSGLCIAHGGGRRCQFPHCTKGAQGSTNLCKAHGGGKRCTYVSCTKGAEGSTLFCKAHGGGKRCTFSAGCSKSVHGGTLFCVAHGGGKRCMFPDCTRSARGRTDFCVRHGGGKRCKWDGCGKSAQGSTDFCKAHGGGKRCSWGHDGSGLGSGDPQCARFARGKVGLCAAHTALLEDCCIHAGKTLGTVPAAHHASMELTAIDNKQSSLQPAIVLPEGRVHGGGLMAFLTRAANAEKRGEGSSSFPVIWL